MTCGAARGSDPEGARKAADPGRSAGGDAIDPFAISGPAAGHVRRLAVPRHCCGRRADQVLFSRWLGRYTSPIDVLDAAGLSLFAVTGAGKALEWGPVRHRRSSSGRSQGWAVERCVTC